MRIKVIGKAQKKVAPDYMRLSISLRGMNIDKSESEKIVYDNFNIVKNFLEKNTRFEIDIKTLSYAISEKYEQLSIDFRRENPDYNPKFLVYEIAQNLSVELPINVGFVLKFINEISKKDEIYISARYYLKDKDEYQSEVMKEAFLKARSKAEYLVGHSNISCISVDYTIREYDNYSEYQTMRRASRTIGTVSTDDIAETIKPADVIIEETICTEWESATNI